MTSLPPYEDCSRERGVCASVFPNIPPCVKAMALRNSMHKIHFQVMVSCVGFISFERFRALCRKMLNQVRKRFLSLQKSARRASLQLGIPKGTVFRTVHDRLDVHLYKVNIVQALNLAVSKLAKTFCQTSKSTKII